jgi:hypothetical protein
MNDALGNEVIIGQKYGYSAKDTVFIGNAVKLTKTRVTLETIKRRYFLYGEETHHSWNTPSLTTSVPSFHLFPIKD